MTKPAPDEDVKPDAFLKNARDIAFIAAVFLYFMGWIYIYNYFKALGLPLKVVDFDLYGFLIYAADVFIYIFNFGKLYLVLIAGIIIALVYWKRASAIAGKLLPLLVVLLFPLLFYVAQKAAISDIRNTLINQDKYLKNISFVFKEDKKENIGLLQSKNGFIKVDQTDSLTLKKDSTIKFAADGIHLNILFQNAREKFKLLAVNKEEYYVLLTSSKVTELNYQSYVPVIYVIKKEMVEFAKITR